ncbi:MAG TPA: hypothetical protein VEW25_08245 [Allosphingosinicella sp.]|nr:hypothetical protein [Allosphingosinicella sp.]
MRHLVLASVAAILVAGLTACDDGAPWSAGNASEPKMKIRNRPHEDLLALPDDLRRVTLIRAIRASRQRCPRRVEPNPVYQGDYRGMALWTARCDNNVQYAVFVAANEDVQVRRCEDMGRLGLPACRALPPAEPQRERPKAKAD